MSREQYNDICKALLAAGANAGEFEELPNDVATVDYCAEHTDDKHSNIFGDFAYVGLRYGAIFHGSQKDFDGKRLVSISDVIARPILH
jgi:hypothetical protein